MRQNHPNKVRGLSLAACAVAMAASVGVSSPDEAAALESIQKYCVASFRNAGLAADDWADCSQNVMAELLDRVSRKRLVRAIDDPNSDERRELNRSIWCVVQRTRRAAKPLSLDQNPVFDQAQDDRREQISAAMDTVMSTASQCLSPRQHRILAMCRDGWTVAEIAEELAIPAPRVSDEKFKAIQKLRQQFAGEEIAA